MSTNTTDAKRKYLDVLQRYKAAKKHVDSCDASFEAAQVAFDEVTREYNQAKLEYQNAVLAAADEEVEKIDDDTRFNR